MACVGDDMSSTTTYRATGVPNPATPTKYTAPVHIDVGGTIYTSSLEVLTRLVRINYELMRINHELMRINKNLLKQELI